jgi:hypothetical protein
MTLRLVVLSGLSMLIISCNCGPRLCEGVKCGGGLVCVESTGKCGYSPDAGDGLGTGGGTGGGTGTTDQPDAATGVCSPACKGETPLCDVATNTCKTCTATTGCGGVLPVCNTYGNGGLGQCVTCTVELGCPANAPHCDPTVQPVGACYECVANSNCVTAGTVCDLNTHSCVINDGGYGGGGGSSGGQGGGTTGPIEVTWNDAGVTDHCLSLDSGIPDECVSECSRGYQCINHQCVLRGSTGAVQVTLRWPHDEDLDLHLLEPKPTGAPCEIWYSAPNAPSPITLPFPLPFECGATGWLDLDSNAACGSGKTPPMLDHKRIENIIYSPTKAPPKGLYTVRVDYYQNCTGLPPPEPFEVEVRANGETRYFCGLATKPDNGSQGSGQTITTFSLTY